MDHDEAARKFRLLQRLAVAALLLAAAIPRGRNLEASFAPGAEGERGTRAALTQLNHERFPELEETITALEIPAGTDRYEGIGEPPWEPLIWRSNSPLEADVLVERASFQFLGVEAIDPEAPVEFAVRVPHLALHLLALLVLWWAISEAFGGQIALMSLAFLTVLPPSIAYSTVSGTENLALLGSALMLGLYARHLQKREWWPLALLAPAACAAALLAPESMAMAALLPLQALGMKRIRAALLGALALWTPVVLLVLESGSQELDVLPRLASRAAAFIEFGPGLLREAVSLFTPIVLGLAAIGVALRFSRSLNAGWSARLKALEFPQPKEKHAEVAAVLLPFGVLAAMLSPDDGGPRLLFSVPIVALGVALFLQQITRPIAAMRAGIAPLVVLASLIAMPCLARFSLFELERRAEPTPRTVGAEIRSFELPPSDLCVIPASLAQGAPLEFYARRTLVPQSYLDRAEAGSVAVRRGIAPWTLAILLPLSSEDEEAEDVAHLRVRARQRASLRAAHEKWEVWR